ncbi:hypothetical protein [Micromonospora sp. KLBMP9576]|uniref:hypothetical protein n=1 Tax=Micromonospora sp. KLBMP9576 TaxID=3424769 RepID=UPI003D8C77BB
MARWDERFGPGRWRLAWRVGPAAHPWPAALALYEDAYHRRLADDPALLGNLLATARDVYDVSVADVQSGLDYTHQRSTAHHLQDVAVRRVLVRLGVWFAGAQLVRLRGSSLDAPSPGACRDSGTVRFHRPDLVVRPVLTGWWDADSVEEFYQSNKYLQTWAGPSGPARTR